MKTFVIGDIHGAWRAMRQVLDASRFDYETDRLICLGDVADGWPEVRQCFDELLKIRDMVYILGNHDWWLLQWFKFGHTPMIWTSQGGTASIRSYLELEGDQQTEVIRRHEKLLDQAVYYYVDDQNRAFVHGGFDWHRPIGDQERSSGESSIYTWDRHLISTAWYWESQQRWNLKNREIAGLKFGDYKKIFIGHTSTSRWDPLLHPLKLTNLWALDQGAGWEGKLTLMDVDTHEYWQSAIVAELYPEVGGRG
ncbi:MAG: metallophosphoesterase [Bacteroidales bacterium]